MKSASAASSAPFDTTRQLEQKLARNYFVTVLLAALSTAASVAECYWLWAHGGESDAACELLKLCSSFLTLWLVGFLFLYYKRKFEHQRSTGALLAQDTLASSGLLISARDWSFVPEALVYFVHAPPFFCAELSLPYYDLRRGGTYPTILNTDEAGAVFMVIARSFLLVRGVSYLAGLSSRNSRAYANLNHLNVTSWLSVRMAIVRRPGRLLVPCTVLLLANLAFVMQVAERRVNHDLDNYVNCAWLVLNAMTGIGFGDLYPQTLLGRAVSGVAYAWGVTILALVVINFGRYMQLSEAEKRVEHMLTQTNNRSELKQRAAFYIQAAWGAYLERLQRSQSSLASASLLGLEPLHADPRFCRTMRAFRELRKDTWQTDDLQHLVFKEILDTRSRVELRLRDLEEKLEEMDQKFEHNIGAMNELLQKNLKYLKHLA